MILFYLIRPPKHSYVISYTGKASGTVLGAPLRLLDEDIPPSAAEELGLSVSAVGRVTSLQYYKRNLSLELMGIDIHHSHRDLPSFKCLFFGTPACRRKKKTFSVTDFMITGKNMISTHLKSVHCYLPPFPLSSNHFLLLLVCLSIFSAQQRHYFNSKLCTILSVTTFSGANDHKIVKGFSSSQ